MFEEEAKKHKEHFASVALNLGLNLNTAETIGTQKFLEGAEFGYNKRTEETENIFDKISELTDKLYLSGLSEKQIAFIEQIQDLIGR